MPTDTVSKTPFSERNAERIAKDLYGIVGTARSLPSYDDQNFFLNTASSRQYVLKLSHIAEKRSIVEGQNAMLAHLHAALTPTDTESRPHAMTVPQVITSQDGCTLTSVTDSHGSEHLARLITFLPGSPMAECSEVSDALLEHLGESVAAMDRALESFSHPGLNRDWIWDLKRAGDVAPFADVHIDQRQRDLVRRIFDDFNRRCRDTLDGLPHGIIHGDANDYNLIVDETHPDRVAGLIDFGDAIHTAVVCEVAITIAYAMLRRTDPVAAGALMIQGYSGVRPLSQAELDLVAPLALTRLAVSVTQSVREGALDPDNNYISVSERSAWQVLETIDALPDGTFESALKAACTIGDRP